MLNAQINGLLYYCFVRFSVLFYIQACFKILFFVILGIRQCVPVYRKLKSWHEVQKKHILRK